MSILAVLGVVWFVMHSLCALALAQSDTKPAKPEPEKILTQEELDVQYQEWRAWWAARANGELGGIYD